MNGADASGTLIAVVLAGGAAAAAAILLGAGWLRARRADRGDEPATRHPRTRPPARGGTDPVLASLGLDYPDRPRGDEDAGYPIGRSR